MSPRAGSSAADASAGRLVDTGKPIAVAKPEAVGPAPSAAAAAIAPNRSLTNASSGGTDRKLTEIARRGSPSRPQAANKLRRLVEHADFRVAKAVDRLLPIADDEDRRRQRVGRGAQPFTPVAHQLRDQLPLRAAGVLEFVDEHVVVPGLEPEPAVRELVHLLQAA